MNERIKNTKRNIIMSYLLMIVQIVFSFASRSIIVYTLGSKYLGLSSLFTSILQVLNIAESGFASSVTFFMYKPLARGDTDKVCALLSYLKTVYRVVGTVIFVVGVSVTPFIKIIIKGDVPSDINVYFLYILYLTNSSISYFLYAYKNSLLTALQRLDLTKIANSIVIIVQYSLQFVALLCFRNYYLFVLAMIFGTALVNIFTAYISKKKFPQYICRGELSKQEKREIKTKVKALLVCNMSSVTYTSLDSIIISAFIGLSSVAKYNNYISIFANITSLIVVVRVAMQASIGNSIASESKESNLESMKQWQFIFSMIASWCTACMICLYQPFMKVWMGEEMLLPMIDVILIGTWFMVGIVQHAYFLYLTGAGLWNEMKWSYVFNTICNLVLNIVLGKVLGISGIIIASLTSCLVSGTFWQCIVLFKCYYNISSKEYLLKQFEYFGIAIVVVGITYFMTISIKDTGYISLFTKALVCATVSSLLLIALTYKSKYFAQSKQLLLKFLHIEKKGKA